MSSSHGVNATDKSRAVIIVANALTVPTLMVKGILNYQCGKENEKGGNMTKTPKHPKNTWNKRNRPTSRKLVKF